MGYVAVWEICSPIHLTHLFFSVVDCNGNKVQMEHVAIIPEESCRNLPDHHCE